MIIAGRLILQGERRVLGWGWVTNHEVPRVDYPPHCVQGECVSGYQQEEGSHLVVGGRLSCHPMLQLTYLKYCYFPISFLKGWGPDIVWH